MDEKGYCEGCGHDVEDTEEETCPACGIEVVELCPECRAASPHCGGCYALYD